MNNNNIDRIVSYVTYGLILLLWVVITFLVFVNTDNYQEQPFDALVKAICAPFIFGIVGSVICMILWYRVDTRLSAIDKIRTDESWDFFETMEFVSMVDEITG